MVLDRSISQTLILNRVCNWVTANLPFSTYLLEAIRTISRNSPEKARFFAVELRELDKPDLEVPSDEAATQVTVGVKCVRSRRTKSLPI